VFDPEAAEVPTSPSQNAPPTIALPARAAMLLDVHAAATCCDRGARREVQDGGYVRLLSPERLIERYRH
jgi:hypothetical protein